MISRRVARKPENDDYKRLAVYIAAADHKNEKSFMSWCAGCLDDDYNQGIQEAMDTQDMNRRSKKEKTYHLIVSFRPEDESKLGPDGFRMIEEEFAKALGFLEHQRHCGVHKNTNNIHMHVAYNMIHPERLIRHEPFRDFHKRDLVCRELERRFGLAIDNGRETREASPKLNGPAATVEAHTGQESFERYAKDRLSAIADDLNNASRWEDLHSSLAKLGMRITPRGNGLVFQDVHNARRAVKASSVDREMSMAKLTKRFGPFEAGKAQHKEEERYQAKPLRGAERTELFTEYKAGRENWLSALDALATERNQKIEEQRAIWEIERRKIQDEFVGRERWQLLKVARARETEERLAVQQAARRSQKNIREKTPYSSWTDFLRWKATQGHETALGILRLQESKEAALEATLTDLQDLRAQNLEVKEKWARKQRELVLEDGLSRKGRQGLLLLAKARELAELENLRPEGPKLFAGFTSEIDARGVVMIRLQGGGIVRDDGRQIMFSMGNEQAQHAALQLAKGRWGKSTKLEGNMIRFQVRERTQTQSRDRSMGR